MDAEALYQEGLRLEQLAEREGTDQAGCQRAAGYRRQAANCWKQAAELGHARAQYQLGWYYYTYSGKNNKNNRAFYWYSKAAEQGDADAWYELGFCYHWGAGTLADRKKSIAAYTEAAERGHIGAILIVADWYKARRSSRKAAYWYEKAAEHYRKAAEEGKPGAAEWLREHGVEKE